ncbi:hypothetical protein Tco_1525611 [Tanacetum coccineum]
MRILDQIKVNPGIPVKAVQDILQRELEVHISISKAFRAKAKAYKEIKDDHYLQYQKLRDYVQGLKASKREILRLYGAFIKKPISRTSVNNSGNRCKQWVSFKQLNMYTLVQNTAATITVSFEKCMNELKSLKVRAHAWLSKLPTKHLSMAHFSSRAHTDILLNNLCEVFTGKIVDGRDKPVITLLEYTREYCMKRIVNVQAVFDKCDELLTPTTTRILDSIKKEEAYIIVQWNGGIKYQVSRLSTWKEVYSHKVQPINDSNNWVKSPCPTTILPPNYRVPIGRPKKKRTRSLCEKDEMVKNGAGTLGGMFGNQGQASGSQAGVSQADMVGSQAFGSQADMVGSQSFDSQANGIGTQTSMAGSGNRVNSDPRRCNKSCSH